MITQGKAKEILSEFEEIDALLQKHDGTPIFAHMQAFSYEKKLKIWDENECRYLAYHIDGTRPDDVIIGILGSSFMMGLKANWTLLNIMPRNSDNFSSFRYWAMDKTPYEPSCIVENEYWEEVGKRPFPERYLTDLIESIESLKKNHYESAAHVEQSRILNPIEMESFKSFCFCVGYDSFCDAREIDWSRLEEKLGYCFCATSIYHFGKCFWATLDAERVATLERFLITQKKRLDKGEDITKPATPPPASTEAALVPPPIEDKPKGKEWEPDKIKARMILNRFDTYLNNEAQKQQGKSSPNQLSEIVSVAINSIIGDSGINIKTERSLTRYVKAIHSKTAKQYAGHYVRQNFGGKIFGISKL